jgi:hypothetical protein
MHIVPVVGEDLFADLDVARRYDPHLIVIGNVLGVGATSRAMVVTSIASDTGRGLGSVDHTLLIQLDPIGTHGIILVSTVILIDREDVSAVFTDPFALAEGALREEPPTSTLDRTGAYTETHYKFCVFTAKGMGDRCVLLASTAWALVGTTSGDLDGVVIHGAKLIPGSRFQVPGSRFQVPGSRFQVLDREFEK